MSTSRTITMRMPLRTQQQVQEIIDDTGYTLTQCIIVAIEQLHRQVVADSPPAPPPPSHSQASDTMERFGVD